MGGRLVVTGFASLSDPERPRSVVSDLTGNTPAHAQQMLTVHWHVMKGAAIRFISAFLGKEILATQHLHLFY